MNPQRESPVSPDVIKQQIRESLVSVSQRRSSCSQILTELSEVIGILCIGSVLLSQKGVASNYSLRQKLGSQYSTLIN